MTVLSSRVARVATVCAVQLALVGVAVAGPLSARATGEEYLLTVVPFDPVDPFRGAYVDLAYPGLTGTSTGTVEGQLAPGERGEVFVPLVQDGQVWRGGEATRARPSAGPYLRCDDSQWRLRCGIESYFLPQGEAKAVERAVAGGTAVSRIRVDSRGNAALIAVERAPAG